MSIPSCIRPQRDPKPLVTGPETGHPSTPLPEGATTAGAEARCCASRMRAASAALCCSSASISASVESRSDWIDARVADFSLRAATSASRLATSRVTIPRCSAVAEETVASTRAASTRAARVRRRASATPSRADLTLAAMRSSWRPILSEQVEVVEEVGEARRPEHERERVRAVGHVELAHPPLEPRQRDPILAAEPLESLRLVGDRPVERSEPRARRAELALEHPETRLLRVDTGLELAHPPRDGAQLLREDAGAPLGVGRLSAQRLDPTVDAGLLRARVAGGGAGREEHAESHQARGGCLEARSTTHHALFAVSFRVPSTGPARSLSSARSASAASRRTTPTTAR